MCVNFRPDKSEPSMFKALTLLFKGTASSLLLQTLASYALTIEQHFATIELFLKQYFCHLTFSNRTELSKENIQNTAYVQVFY